MKRLSFAPQKTTFYNTMNIKLLQGIKADN